MKDLKVKDLDPVLQDCISEALRKKSLLITNYDSTPVSELFKYVDWSKCTDYERLKYAELMYYEGVTFLTITTGAIKRSSGRFGINQGDIVDIELVWCVYFNNKWATILSRPDEKEETKPLFKVGDRPQWTEELIKQLPHGTVLKCAFHKKDFVYSGQELFINPCDDIMILHYFGQWSGAFFYALNKGYAEIISLPEETKEPFRIYFSDNCTPEQRAEIEKMFKEYYNKTSTAGPILMNKEPEFQPGEMVKVSNNDCFADAFYRFFAGGKHWASDRPTSRACHTYDHIRKIQPDPDEELKQLAKEICKEWDDNKYFNAEVMLLEMGKRVKNKIG